MKELFDIKKYKEIFFCSLFAVVIGVVMGIISGVFGQFLDFIEEVREIHYIKLVPFMGAAGCLILYMYQKISPKSEQGLNLAIAYNMGEVSEDGEVKNNSNKQMIGKYPKGYVFLRLAANAVMLLFGASTGKEGTIATCGAAVGDYVSRIFKSRRYSKTLLIAGVSAAVAGLFQTPLGGMFFALEFSASGVLFYPALIPAFIGAYVAFAVSNMCGFTAFHHNVAADFAHTPKNILIMVICAVIFGLLGRLFVYVLEGSKELYGKKVKNRYIGMLAAGCVMAAVLIFVKDGRYCGTGASMINEIFNHGTFEIYDFVLKFIFTVICITIGFTGGEMMPLMAMGAAAGAALSSLTGMPLELSALMGCAAVYSSATNTLLAPMFISMEMFGTQNALFIAAACVIAFAINGNSSIYTSQRHANRSLYGALKR